MTSQSRVLSSEGDRGPLINILGWLLLTLNALAVLARVGTRWRTSRSFDWGDAAIAVAFVSAIGQMATISIATDHGLGKRGMPSSGFELNVLQKAVYASEVLLLSSLYFGRMAVAMTVRSLKPHGLFKKAIQGTTILIVLCSIASVLAVAFQCHLPTPWAFVQGVCTLDMTRLSDFCVIMGIALDLVLIVTPIYLIMGINTTMLRRIIVSLVFSCRCLVIGTSIAQLVLTHSLGMQVSEDVLYDISPIIITLSALQSLSLVTASLPYLNPFFQSLQSGMIRSDDLYRRTVSRAAIHGNSSSQQSGKSRIKSTPSRSKDSEHELRTLQSPFASITSVEATRKGSDDFGIGYAIRESMAGDARIIRATTMVEVDSRSRTSASLRTSKRW